jgi:hypothetical protein
MASTAEVMEVMIVDLLPRISCLAEVMEVMEVMIATSPGGPVWRAPVRRSVSQGSCSKKPGL